MSQSLLSSGPFASVVLDPHSQAAQTSANAATQAQQTPTTATAQSAHQALIGIGLELAFVVVAVMLAGISDQWGTAMVVLMLGLLLLRGLFDVDTFASFASSVTKPLQRTT